MHILDTKIKYLTFAATLALWSTQLVPFVTPSKRNEGLNTIYDFTNVPATDWSGQSIGYSGTDPYNKVRIYTMRNDTSHPVYVRVGYHEYGCWGTGLDMPAKFSGVMVTQNGCSPQRLTGFIFPNGRDKPGIPLVQGDGVKGANYTKWHVVTKTDGTTAIELMR